MIEPLLPNKPRGVPRVEDRRVLNGIRSGAPWRDLPERYGPCTICYNRFNRWRKKGIWDRLMGAIVEAYDGNIQMIDISSVRAHQHAGLPFSSQTHRSLSLAPIVKLPNGTMMKGGAPSAHSGQRSPRRLT